MADEETTLEAVAEAAQNSGVTESAEEKEAVEVETVAEDGAETPPESDPWEGVDWRHRHAAERGGLDPEIARNLGATALESLAKGQDAISATFAKLGEAMRTKPAEQPKTGDVPPANETAKQKEVRLALEALEDGYSFNGYALEKDYSEKVMRPILERLAAAEDRLAATEGKFNPVAERIAQAEKQAAENAKRSVVQGFIKSAVVQSGFADIYGPADRRTATAEQKAKEEALGAMAESIFLGARQAGVELDENDCLMRALFAMNPERLAQRAQQEAQKAVTGRRAQLTTKPGGRQSVPATGEAKAVSAVARLLQKFKSG